jgi:putative endonuclease
VPLRRGGVDPGEGFPRPDDGGVRPALPGVRALRTQGVPHSGAPRGAPPTGPLPDPPQDISWGAGGTTPPEARRGLGDAAEERACRFLEGAGFAIAERNWRGNGGEADIVARKGDLLAFVEVRSREDASFGTPEESVDLAKRRRIVAAAREYLSTIPPGSWREARFDVIAIEGTGETAVLRHYPGAFDARGKIL